MGEVVSVEVDGELGEPRFAPEPPRSSWGMPVAITVVGAMVLALGWSVLRPSPDPRPARSLPTPTTVGASAKVTDDPGASGPSSTVRTPTTVAASDLTDPVSAARVALSRWGEFAATGDLVPVRGVFDAEGPQLAQLEAEARRCSSDGPAPRYAVTLADPGATTSGNIATVTGIVVWSRIGEADQTYRWSIELHRAADGTWRLFNVRKASA